MARTDRPGDAPPPPIATPVPKPDPSVVAEPRRTSPLTGRLPVLSPGIRATLAGAFFFSVMSMLVKAAGERLPTEEIVLARAVVTLVLAWTALRLSRDPMWGQQRGLLVVRGFVGYLGLFAFYYAYLHLPLAEATVIQATTPVLTALIAAAWLGERMGRRDVAMALVALTGVLIVARPGAILAADQEGLDLLAVGVAFGGAVASATAYTMVRRLRSTEKPMTIVFYFALVSVVVSVPLTIPVFVMPTPFEWLLLLGVGVSTHLGQVSLTRGLHLETAGRATVAGYSQIVFAASWGALFFAELPDAMTILGAGVIVTSTLVIALRRSEPGRTDPRAGSRSGPR
jgi:drug/metabolite transporter (DMT)-like permease